MDEWISATRCWSPSPSPDGATIAFVWDGYGRPAVRMHRRATGEEWSLDTGPDLVSAVRWSPDGQWLALETAPDGGERTSVSVIRPDGADLRIVRGVGDTDRGAVSLDRWTHTGSVLAVTESDVDTTTAWLVDAGSDQRRRLGSGHALRILDVSTDRRRVLLRRGRRGSRHVGIVDLDATDGWHSVDSRRGPGGPPGAVEHPVAITWDSSEVAGRFVDGGRRMVLLTDGGRERAALVAVDVVGAATDASPTTPEVLAERVDADLEHIALTEDGGLAALGWNVAGRSELDLLDLATGKATPYSPPGDVVTSAVFSHDGDSLVMGVQSPEVPAAVWCHAISTGSTALVCPRAEPSWTPGALVHPTLETVTTPDGLSLHGWLYRPRGTADGRAGERLPLVIYLHGGPEAQERPVFTPLYQVLLARGIAIYAANVRGSSGFGRSFVNADNGAGRFAAIRDVASCVEHLVETGVADPARVGCMGRSYGGYLTLAALVNHPELFAVGVDVCGMADFETFFARTEPWIADSAVGEYGHPIHDRNLLRELSPVHRMDRLAAPLLVVHGRFDTNVPVHEAELAVHGAKSAGVPVKYLLFDDEGHEIQRTENRVRFVHEVTEWLADHLGADVPPS